MKTNQSPLTAIDEYIADFPPEVQQVLGQIRKTISDVAPGAEEAIRYGLPTFLLDGNLVHFGAFKGHVGFYPTPSGIEAFQEELSVYKGAKGSVRFPMDKPIPFDLIRRIVEYRVKEVQEKASGKKGRK